MIIVHNPMQHDCMKHVWVDINFIKTEIRSRKINLPYVPTRSQETDMFTKVLTTWGDFESNVRNLGMIDVHSPAWGGCRKVIRIPDLR